MSRTTLTAHSAKKDPRNCDIRVRVSGEIVRRDDVRVSARDSGFMPGAGVWEGMRLYDGKWAFGDDHMDRLFASRTTASPDVRIESERIADALRRTAEAGCMTENERCRVVVTRGAKAKPFQHPGLSSSGPTVLITMEHTRFGGPFLERDIRRATVPQLRGLPHPRVARFNSPSRLNRVIACHHAGSEEALMPDPHGSANTTHSCNSFAVLRGHVWISTGNYCVNGTIRRKAIDLGRGTAYRRPGGILRFTGRIVPTRPFRRVRSACRCRSAKSTASGSARVMLAPSGGASVASTENRSEPTRNRR